MLKRRQIANPKACWSSMRISPGVLSLSMTSKVVYYNEKEVTIDVQKSLPWIKGIGGSRLDKVEKVQDSFDDILLAIQAISKIRFICFICRARSAGRGGWWRVTWKRGTTNECIGLIKGWSDWRGLSHDKRKHGFYDPIHKVNSQVYD